MPTVADVLRRHGEAYLQRFGAAMPAEQKKVLHAIMACRTGQLGTVFYACSACNRWHVRGRSCGNRHCPNCQRDKTRDWLEKQTARLLPCPYFLLTFTLPAELRRFVRAHQRNCYAALFTASSEAIKRLAADPRRLGSRNTGCCGVLHTWGRTLEYHPHVHYIVPGGGVSEDGARWLPSRVHYFLPVKALSRIFRGKFRDAMRQAGLLDQIPADVWRREWVVHSQAVGDGTAALKYLAPYVFRVAISDHRILACDDTQVTFSYRPSGTSRWRKMTLDAMEFLRRFLQHVLPSGLQKVRHYGFLSPNSSLSLEAIRWLVTLHNDEVFELLAMAVITTSPHPRGPRCPRCGGTLLVVVILACRGSANFDTS